MKNNLCNKIKEIPILFSQTREDSAVEQSCLNGLVKCKLLMIGSAGDTILNLMSENNDIDLIDIVDTNNGQLNLAKLKIALYKRYSCDKLKIILNNSEGILREVNYKCILNDLYINEYIDKDTNEFWQYNIKYLINGINFEGRFEKLFKLANKENNYEIYFSNDILKLLFSNKAIKYSKKKSFVKHFNEIYSMYKNTDNYFKDSFMDGKYKNFPPYLINAKKINPTIRYNLRELHMHCKYSSNNEYDIVNISNITDWMSPLLFQNLFDDLFRVLKNNGKIIVRRLNSDILIENYLLKKYKSNYIFDIIKYNDKSHFYAETLVVIKREL